MKQSETAPSAVSVVIRSKTDSRLLLRILERLREQKPDVPEIVLIDSGSSTEILGQARDLVDIVIEIPPESFNSGGALNRAIKRANGGLIAILSHDALPTSNRYIAQLAEAFDDPNTAGAYGRQIARADDHPLNIKDMENTYPPRSRVQKDDPWFDNACSMIRADLWGRRPFDESMRITEDHGWAKWAQSQGHVIRYVAEATVEHSHPRFLKRAWARFREEGRGLALLHNKSYPAWRAMFDWARDIASDALWLTRRGRILWIPASIPDRTIRRLALYLGWRQARREVVGGSRIPG